MTTIEQVRMRHTEGNTFNKDGTVFKTSPKHTPMNETHFRTLNRAEKQPRIKPVATGTDKSVRENK